VVKNKTLICLITGMLLAGFNVSADELAELKAELARLAGKVAALEAQQTALSTQQTALTTQQAVMQEKQASLPEVPGWVENIKIKGDLRARYENRTTDGSTSKDRQRLRARIGAYGSVNEFVDFGIRLATGDKEGATSTNESLDDNFNIDGVWLDLMYADIHPDLFGGAHVIIGKMPKPWIKGSGLIWDGDTNPEGVAVKYNTGTNLAPVKLIASAGYFVLEDNGGDDLKLYSGQLAAEGNVESVKLQAGAGVYLFTDPMFALAMGKNTAAGEFNLIEGFGSATVKVADMPVKLHGQYVVNTEAATGEDTAYLFGVKLGKAKKPGSWEVGYNWRDTGRDAVPDLFNDSDFADGDTGSRGHQIKGKYQIDKNFQAGIAWLDTVNGDGVDENTLQLDLLFKF